MLVLLTLGGCGPVQDLVDGLLGAEEAKGGPVAAAPEKPAPKANTPEGAARAALAGDDAALAVTATLAAVVAAPTDAAAWDRLDVLVGRSGQAAALLDQLAAGEAIGGNVERHMAVRARAALLAGRPADALAAADLLAAVQPGDGAAWAFRAIRAGAPTPAAPSPLVTALLAAAADPPAGVSPEVTSAPGGELALVRAELARASADAGSGAPASEVSSALSALGDRPVLRLRALPLRTAAGAPGAAMEEAQAVATALGAIGAWAEAGDALATQVGSAAGAGKAAGLLEATRDLATKAGEAKAGPGALGVISAARAEAALRAGRPAEAREAAQLASVQAASKSRGQWSLSLAAAMLGDADAVEAAATGMAGERIAAARDLAGALRGAAPQLPSPGLAGDDAALQALLGAGWLAAPQATCRAAAEAAVGADLRTWALLACDRGTAPAPQPATPALTAELAARAWLAGSGGGGLGDTSHPSAAGWQAAMAGTGTGGSVQGAAGLRAALRAKDSNAAATAISELSAGVPAWRSGPLAPVLVLDGPVVGDFLRDATSLATLDDPAPAATAFHAWAQRARSRAALWSFGVAYLPGATPEAVPEVFGAHAALRAGQIAWLLGAPWPTAEADAFTKAVADAKIAEAALPSLSSAREAAGRSAVLSFLELPDGLQALYLTPSAARVANLGARVSADVAAYNAELAAGRTPLRLGDAVRASALDPAMDVLAGVGHYLVIGGDGAAMLPVAQLPEQVDGLRYLASIRLSTHVPDFDSLLSRYRAQPEYAVTALALCANPEEAETARRVWPDVVAKVGAEVTRAAWAELAPKARYLHLGGFPAAPGGGLRLPGGEVLSVRDLASRPLVAMSAVVDAEADARTALGRASALQAAGVGDVMHVLWRPGPTFHGTVLSNYWDGVNKRKAPSRALETGRSQGVKIGGAEAELPGAWGGYLVVSAL